MRMEIPLVQRHCINGIDKQDAENIKEIPELDERVTALEMSSFSEWTEIDVSTYQKANAYVEDLFDFDGDHYFTKYNMVVTYRTGMYFVHKDLDIDVSGNSTNIYATYLHNGETSCYINEEVIRVKNIFFSNPVEGSENLNISKNQIVLNKTNSEITYTTIGSVMYRNRLRVFVIGYETK